MASLVLQSILDDHVIRMEAELSILQNTYNYEYTLMINLLMNPYKDPTHPANYCPSSLISTDKEIISKA